MRAGRRVAVSLGSVCGRENRSLLSPRDVAASGHLSSSYFTTSLLSRCLAPDASESPHS